GFGITSGFVSITVHPIPTDITVNETIVDVYINRSFYLKINYTEEVSGAVINGAILNISWTSFYNITPVADGFIVSFSTINLSLTIYTILLELSHPGHESGFHNVYVNVIPKTTSLKILLNQEDKTSDRSLSIPGNEPLNITIIYKDTITDSFISGATVELNGSGLSEILTENGNQYSIIFDSGNFSIGIHFLSITIQKENYNIVPIIIKITVLPISTIITVNETIVDVYINRSFFLKVNFTEEISSAVINGATLNVSWASFYNIIPVANGFIVNFSTIDLSLAIYTILLELSHPGHESGFQNVYVNVIPKTTSLQIFLNQEDKTADRSLSIPGNELLNITILYKDTITNSFISGATVELNGSGLSETLTENGQQYSIIFNPGDFSIGIHFFSITIQKENYNMVPSIIKITIDQIEILAETIGVTGTLELFAGDSFSISIILTEEGSGKLIENANVSYSWLSYLDEIFTNIGDGIYEIQIKIPNNAKGSYTIDLIIIIEGTQFKNRIFPLSIYVLQKPTPNYLIWIILGVLIPVIGVLSALSLRNYVLIPRKRKKERLFMNTIQVFKDVKNIQ
ncbi:hypothetical protein LCGC14_2310990, partial [marine sediment metagenome]